MARRRCKTADSIRDEVENAPFPASNRPRAAESQNKKKNVKKEKKGPKESYFKKVNKEMKLVKWPEGKEVLKYTISTIIFCLVLCALFMLLNLILSVVKGWL